MRSHRYNGKWLFQCMQCLVPDFILYHLTYFSLVFVHLKFFFLNNWFIRFSSQKLDYHNKTTLGLMSNVQYQ